MPQISEDEWDAVVVMHTWENWNPQADAKLYIDHVKDISKVIVLSTSGRGSYKIEGINSIASASNMIDVSARTMDIINRLDLILERVVQN